MASEKSEVNARTQIPLERRLSGKLFYGIIILCFLLGLVASCLGGWIYLNGDLKPTSRGIWDDTSTHLIIPICAMIGATFGGLTGVVLAAGCSAWVSQRSKRTS